MLHADAERGTRTVLVRFPDGWKRDAVGHQPAGEEMVLLSGELTLSGLTVGTGELLVVEPRATRSATSVADDTRALVWFSGPGGGWTDGPAADAGRPRSRRWRPGSSAVPTRELVGTVTVHDELARDRSSTPTSRCSGPRTRHWARVPAGTPVPVRPGRAVVHHFG